MQASHSLSLRHSGFTIIELLVAVAVASVVGLSIAALARDTVSFNRYYQSSFSVADRAQKLLRPMAEEIRSASQSVAGAYPIDTAGTNEFIFYADIDNDGLVDRVRYYLSGTSLLKDVVAPAGSPLTYTLANAVTTTPVTNVQNAALGTPIFTYYDSSHTGGETGAVAAGGDVSLIRLIRITLVVDTDINKPPAAQTITTLVSMRNLKQQL